MNGLSDSVTIGIVLALVFGALFFYMYSRVTQNEKRVSLIENMLIDLKMTFEDPQRGHFHSMEEDIVNHIEPVSAPVPLAAEDVDTNEEDMYKNVLASTLEQHQNEEQEVNQEKEQDESSEMKMFDLSTKSSTSSSKVNPVQVTKVQPNYESMSSKELKQMLKSRNLTVPNGAGKKEIISTLRKADGTVSTAHLEGGTFLNANEGAVLEEEVLE